MSIVEDTALKIEALFETAQAGEPMAYFELEKNGETKRGIYVVYAFIANEPNKDQELADALVKVFEEIKAQGGKHLYWRRPLELADYDVEPRRRIYARVCVLDENWDDVTRLPDAVDNLMGRVTRNLNGEPIEEA